MGKYGSMLEIMMFHGQLRGNRGEDNRTNMRATKKLEQYITKNIQRPVQSNPNLYFPN